MAYMNQERKNLLAPGIKAVLKKYGMKGSVAVRHHSTLIVNVKSGDLDVITNWMDNPRPYRSLNENEERPEYLQVNQYWISEHFSGEVREFLLELLDAMNAGPGLANHDRSDSMTDYFDVGWYVDINIGHWSKPYLYTGSQAEAA